MAQFEYKVVPAPARGEKVKGVKAPEMRFASTVEGVLNTMAEDGWEFVRSEMLPSEERSGLSRTSKEWRNLLIFRRAKTLALPEPAPAEVEQPTAARRPLPPHVRARKEPPQDPVTPVRAEPETFTRTRPEPEPRARNVARQVRGPAEDMPEEQADDVAQGPFEVRSVDEAGQAGPFRSWRDRN